MNRDPGLQYRLAWSRIYLIYMKRKPTEARFLQGKITRNLKNTLPKRNEVLPVIFYIANDGKHFVIYGIMQSEAVKWTGHSV